MRLYATQQTVQAMMVSFNNDMNAMAEKLEEVIPTYLEDHPLCIYDDMNKFIQDNVRLQKGVFTPYEKLINTFSQGYHTQGKPDAILAREFGERLILIGADRIKRNDQRGLLNVGLGGGVVVDNPIPLPCPSIELENELLFDRLCEVTNMTPVEAISVILYDIFITGRKLKMKLTQKTHSIAVSQRLYNRLDVLSSRFSCEIDELIDGLVHNDMQMFVMLFFDEKTVGALMERYGSNYNMVKHHIRKVVRRSVITKKAPPKPKGNKTVLAVPDVLRMGVRERAKDRKKSMPDMINILVDTAIKNKDHINTHKEYNVKANSKIYIYTKDHERLKQLSSELDVPMWYILHYIYDMVSQ